MSRNLCKDQCCGNKIKLADLVGKPLEFRKYYDYRPTPGVKWRCPKCERVFFIHIRSGHTHWGDTKNQFDKDDINYGRLYSCKNANKNKFAKRTDHGVEELGWYEFDMSYYETYNDEGEGVDTNEPAHLCTEDDERTRRYC